MTQISVPIAAKTDHLPDASHDRSACVVVSEMLRPSGSEWAWYPRQLPISLLKTLDILMLAQGKTDARVSISSPCNW